MHEENYNPGDMKRSGAQRTKNYFNAIIIFIGIVFISEPNINGVDFLPDFIGYLLIWLSLTEISYILDYFSDAKRIVRLGFFYSFFKYLLGLAVFMSGVMKQGSENIMLLVFFTSVVDIILYILILNNIQKGIGIYLTFNESKEISNLFDITRVIALIYPFVKALMQIITEIPVLFSESTFDYLTIRYNVYLNADILKSNFLFPCMMIAFISFFLMLSVSFPFYFKLSKDMAFSNLIKSRINDYIAKHKYFYLEKGLMNAVTTISAGLIFIIGMTFDGINFLPDFLCGILVLIGIIQLKNCGAGDEDANFFSKVKILAIFYIIISAVSYVFEICGNMIATEQNHILLISEKVVYNISVFFLFCMLIFAYDYICSFSKRQEKYAASFLGKYISDGEKNFIPDKKYVYILFIAAFLIKLSTVYFSETGYMLFIISALLIVFDSICINFLFSFKNNVFSNLNTK